MKQSNALAYLRQLCCLGLDKEMVMPEFLRAVSAAIPSDFNVFKEVNEQLVPSRGILGYDSAGFLDMYDEVNRDFWTTEKQRRAAQWFSRHPVITDITLIDENFYRSDMYNLLYRSFNMHHCVHAPILLYGKPAAMLSLTRPHAKRPFKPNEQMLCVHLTSYLSHALQTSGIEDLQYSEGAPSGMMIMDITGMILYISETAKNLLTLLRHLPTPPNDHQETGIPPELIQLCRNLDTIFRGKNAAPPSWTHTNGRGRFTFRAYWLDKQNREPGGLIGITIEHQEPLVLKLLRAMQPLPLSPTQREVALLLAQGASSEQIGKRLHIKATTVKDHIGKIFTKLDIHHREQLLPKLLALENANDVFQVSANPFYKRDS